MMRGKWIAGSVVAVLGGSLTLTVWAADLTIDQMPEKVKAVLERLAGNNRITEVESEKEHGVQVYEASWMVDGKEHEAEVTADGVLLEMEESVDANDVPEAVRAAAEKALAGAQKIHYEKHTIVTYEVEAKIDGKEKELKISPTGQISGQEKQEGNADDGDDDADGDDEDDDADGDVEGGK